MDIRNCKRCGNIFGYDGIQICVNCRKLEDEDFHRLKEYLRDNPGTTIIELSKAVNVSAERIRRYLKDGRLEIVGSDSNMVLDCEGCGKSINSGRYCGSCQRDLMSGLKKATSDGNPSDDSKSDSKDGSNKKDTKSGDGKKPNTSGAPGKGTFRFIGKEK